MFSFSNPRYERLPQLRRFLFKLSAALIALFLLGFTLFASGLRTTPRDYANADAIVVLTGTAPERIRVGIGLLAQARAKRLLVSGVHKDLDFDDVLAFGQLETMRKTDMITCCIDLDYSARNTIGNARQTASWAEIHNFRSLIIVTSAHHMPRAILELRRTMPTIVFSPHPVVPDRVRLDAWWRFRGTISLLMGEYARFLWSLANLSGRA